MLFMMNGNVGELTPQGTFESFDAPQEGLSDAERELSTRAQVTDKQLIEERNHSKRACAANGSGFAALRQTISC